MHFILEGERDAYLGVLVKREDPLAPVVGDEDDGPPGLSGDLFFFSVLVNGRLPVMGGLDEVIVVLGVVGVFLEWGAALHE